MKITNKYHFTRTKDNKQLPKYVKDHIFEDEEVWITYTITISGLGTSTIIKILNNDKLNQINKLIIQSNNDHYLLRSYILLKGFYISHESVIYEKSHYYINIVFKRGKKKYTIKELKYGPILINTNNEYYNFLLKKKEAIIDNIPKYKVLTRLKHQKERRLLKKLAKK